MLHLLDFTDNEDDGVVVPLISSNLNSCSWKPNTISMSDVGTLTITFKGNRVYRYEDVPRDVFHGLVNAPSPGGYFHASIRNEYDVI